MFKKSYTDSVFDVSPEHGFLPVSDPIAVLPDRYSELQLTLNMMPITLKDGSQGLLSTPNQLSAMVQCIPNYILQIQKEDDPMLLAALFRSYAFLSSAYLLEPAYQHFKRTGEYGQGLSRLPENLAVPFSILAKRMRVIPYLDYHYAYSLGNYVRLDSQGGLDWQNLGMANSFSGSPDEVGFIMVHVDINQNSPDLIDSILKTLRALEEKGDLVEPLMQTWKVMQRINERRKMMWHASNHKNYNDFRIFIMGIKGNDSIFPNGVIYEGVSDEPQFYRGQTGAQDDIIPTVDIFSGLISYYPKNELTTYLLDLRTYRPEPVRRFFTDLTEECDGIYSKIKEREPRALIPLLGIVDEIYKFRDGHWQFVQKYIMANTKYARATGGTPITSWLPNQILACLEYMECILDELKRLNFADENVQRISSDLPYRKDKLNRQIEEMKNPEFDPNEIHALNTRDKDYDVK